MATLHRTQQLLDLAKDMTKPIQERMRAVIEADKLAPRFRLMERLFVLLGDADATIH